MRLLLSCLFCLSFFCGIDFALAEEQYFSGNQHFDISRSPYYFEKKIIFSEGRLTIDKGVQIDFGPDSGLCLPGGQCLVGDWLVEDGVNSCSVEFKKEVVLSIGSGKTDLRLEVSHYDPGNGTISKNKTLPVLVQGDNFSYLLRLVADAYYFEVFLKEAKFVQGGDSVGVFESSSSLYGPSVIDRTFSDSKKGFIFIEVEKKGEAWYVNPE
jgi:hypothetical protein